MAVKTAVGWDPLRALISSSESWDFASARSWQSGGFFGSGGLVLASSSSSGCYVVVVAMGPVPKDFHTLNHLSILAPKKDHKWSLPSIFHRPHKYSTLSNNSRAYNQKESNVGGAIALPWFQISENSFVFLSFYAKICAENPLQMICMRTMINALTMEPPTPPSPLGRLLFWTLRLPRISNLQTNISNLQNRTMYILKQIWKNCFFFHVIRNNIQWQFDLWKTQAQFSKLVLPIKRKMCIQRNNVISPKFLPFSPSISSVLFEKNKNCFKRVPTYLMVDVFFQFLNILKNQTFLNR